MNAGYFFVMESRLVLPTFDARINYFIDRQVRFVLLVSGRTDIIFSCCQSRPAYVVGFRAIRQMTIIRLESPIINYRQAIVS